MKVLVLNINENSQRILSPYCTTHFVGGVLPKRRNNTYSRWLVTQCLRSTDLLHNAWDRLTCYTMPEVDWLVTQCLRSTDLLHNAWDRLTCYTMPEIDWLVTQCLRSTDLSIPTKVVALIMCEYMLNISPYLRTRQEISVNFQHDAQNSYLFIYKTFIKILYMFPALPCSSSGGIRRNCVYAASGMVILCRWLSCALVNKVLS